MKYFALLALTSLCLAHSSVSAADAVVLTLNDFTDEKEAAVPAGWVTEDGVIHRAAKAGSLISKKEFKNFELEWEWKVGEGGNSGIKYWVTKHEKGGWLGIEYQLIDDDKHPDAKKGDNHNTASIYDIKGAAADKPVKKAGEWNQSKIIAKDGKIQHFLNGTLVAEADTTTPEWQEMKAKSKFKAVEGFAPGKGRFLLQDHGDEVWLRNLVLKEL